MTPTELMEATRGFWRISPQRHHAEFAFAVFRGVVKEVYRIDGWHPAGTLKYASRDPAPFVDKGRWEFFGEIASSIRADYLNRSVAAHFGRGAQNPIHYVNC